MLVVRKWIGAIGLGLALFLSYKSIPEWLAPWIRLPDVPIYWVELLALPALLVLWRERTRLREAWRNIPVDLRWFVLFLLAGCVVGVCVAPGTLAALGGVKTWVVVPMLLAAALLLRPTWQDAAVYGLYVFILLQLVVGLPEVLVERTRLTGTLLSPNFLAMAMVPAGLIAYVRTKQHRWEWAVAGIALIGLLLSASIGGLLAALAAIAFIILRGASVRIRWAMGAAGLVLIAAAGWLVQGRLAVGEVNSFASRVEIWQTGYRLTQLYPLGGVGIRGFEKAYAENVALVIERAPIEWVVPQPHNVVLGFWLNFGIAGLIALVFLVIWALGQLRRGNLAVLALAALLVHGLVDTPYFKTEVALIFWLALVVALNGRDEGSRGDRPELRRGA